MNPGDSSIRNCTIFLVITSVSSVIFTACQTVATTNELVLIPAGTFLMGSDIGRASNQPQHEVFLDDYYIQKTEVTRAQFIEFLDATKYSILVDWLEPDDANSSLPATGVLWRDADAYCGWAGLRLPTEAEWEKAARGTNGSIYPWGNQWNPDFANGAGKLSSVQEVGSYPQGASPFSLLDMSGNAAEWVADYYVADYYTYAPSENPQGPEIVLDHVLRGGSYASPLEQLTTFFRNSSHSVLPNPRVGFRCAISADEMME